MNIGLFFGSFNPIHVGHLIIANHILNASDLDKIWFVVSPQNPLKPSGTLLNEYDRLHLVQTAVADDARLKASDIEFGLPRPSFTIDTLTYLQEKYPDKTFGIIMGSDSFQNLPKWKNGDVIQSRYRLLVYTRPGFELTNNPENVETFKAPRLDISATYIRELIRQKKSIKYLVSAVVEEEIAKSGLFKTI